MWSRERYRLAVRRELWWIVMLAARHEITTVGRAMIARRYLPMPRLGQQFGPVSFRGR